MDVPSSFGYWVRRRRKLLDLTQDVLARQVGCAKITIQKIEADERRPSRQIAERLADCLAVPGEERTAFLQAARAELRVERLAPPAELPVKPPPPAKIDDRSRQTIKGYTLRERLGSGGFGVVYRAEQPAIGREVAIKIILPQRANHPEFIRRFEAEAQIVARLEHPQIVPLYDYWREPGSAYLVMRYIRGGNLQAILGDGPLPLASVVRLLDQIAAALGFAHRHSVVHRDLKPANILLDEEGNAYLADFGIAKDLSSTAPGEQTDPGAIVGSPAYLSPEQIRDEPTTPQSDIYSLGMLLYELLAGEHPFGNVPPAELLAKQLHEPLPSLHTRRADIGDAVDTIIQKATAKQPTDRYPDAARLVADFLGAVGVRTNGTPLQLHHLTTRANGVPDLADAARVTADARTVAAVDLVTATDLAAVENPYKGLRAFGEADAADFFGRTALVQHLIERMAEETSGARPAADAGGGSPPARVGSGPGVGRGAAAPRRRARAHGKNVAPGRDLSRRCAAAGADRRLHRRVLREQQRHAGDPECCHRRDSTGRCAAPRHTVSDCAGQLHPIRTATSRRRCRRCH